MLNIIENKNIKEVEKYEVGICLLNEILYIYSEEEKTVEIKPTKDHTNGGLEKQIAKAIPALMKYFNLELSCEIIQTIMNMIGKREIGHWGENFNLRVVYDWSNEENPYILKGWF